ncbi:MAG: AAA family ATPase [Myxococcota bacterium]|nr:AAA family ATPase [Myxococcota bacterium]
MYTAFFGLREKPFALSPDPRFLFLSEAHREALAHLLYGIEQGEGFIAVTGEVGTGKTTLCRTLLRRLGSEFEVAFLFNPKLSARELLEAVLKELGLEAHGANSRELIEVLNEFLLDKRREGRRVLLIVDEAQGLPAETLEQIRLLSNLETESDKLIQILLLGQPELAELLESEELRQLRQRIGVHWRLAPLSRGETAAYVLHRLRIAAGSDRNLFTSAALRDLHARSGGIPRRVNLLADRALLAAYAETEHRVGSRLVRRAGAELRGSGSRRKHWRRLRGAALGAAALAAVAALAGLAFLFGTRAVDEAAPGPEPAPVAAAPAAVAAPPPTQAMHAGAGLPAPVAPATVVAATAPAPAAALAAIESPATSPRVADLGAALAERTPSATASGSWLGVLEAWSLTPPQTVPVPMPFEDVLAGLAARGLDLFPLADADLELLRRLGHPALLRLAAADGTERAVALRWLDAEWAELVGVSQAGPVSVSRAELMRTWGGEAWIVWRDFEPLPDLLRPGDSGEPVLWLQRSLAQLGFLPTGPSGYFDTGTELAVRAFQADRRLQPDGTVGPLTKMSLYEALGYTVPRLSRSAERTGGVG